MGVRHGVLLRIFVTIVILPGSVKTKHALIACAESARTEQPDSSGGSKICCTSPPPTSAKSATGKVTMKNHAQIALPPGPKADTVLISLKQDITWSPSVETVAGGPATHAVADEPNYICSTY